MASSGTTTMGSIVILVDTDDDVVLTDDDGSTRVGMIHQGRGSSDIVATSVSGRVDISLTDVNAGP